MQSPTATESLPSTETIIGSHKFTIKSYSQEKGIGIGKHITSGTFTVGGHEWEIYFFPDGMYQEDDSMYVSVAVVLVSDATDVKARFELTLFDQSQKENHKVIGHYDLSQRREDPYTFANRWSQWSYRHYFTRTDLEASGHLKDDCLEFYCILGVEVPKIDPPQIDSIKVLESDVNSQFGMLLKDEMGSDIQFNVSGESFFGHRLVFTARCPVFQRKYLDVDSEINDVIQIIDMEPLVFKAFLHFLYTDYLLDDIETELSRPGSLWETLPVKLLSAACRYNLCRLRVMCEAVLLKNLSVESVSDLLTITDQYSSSGLRFACLRFAAENIDAIEKTKRFESLHHELQSIVISQRGPWIRFK